MDEDEATLEELRAAMAAGEPAVVNPGPKPVLRITADLGPARILYSSGGGGLGGRSAPMNPVTKEARDRQLLHAV